jgi:riboflavin kinase/FMN adenylyltransferase
MIIKGTVIKGRGVGKQLGIPTANVKLNEEYIIPEQGVYSGWINFGNKKYKAAIFVGPRLTFNLKDTSVEAVIIDFDSDLYGQNVELEIVNKIRDVKKFNSTQDLRKQILKDIALVES